MSLAASINRNIKGSAQLRAEIKRVTPQVAKEWLKNFSLKNRWISKSRVRRYAKAMGLGEWVLGQPILRNQDGLILDGYHRLKAVIESGVEVEFVVISGYDREKTFGRIDDVQARKLSHWLQMHDEELPDVLAATIGYAARWDAGLIPTGNMTLTPVEGLEFLDEHPEIRESISGPGTVNPLAPRAMLCFFHWAASKRDKTLAKEFLIDLALGERDGEGDPLYLLHQRLRSNREAKTKLPRTEVIALIFKAWNAVRAGKKIAQLKWNSTGSAAEPFPPLL